MAPHGTSRSAVCGCPRGRRRRRPAGPADRRSSLTGPPPQSRPFGWAAMKHMHLRGRPFPGGSRLFQRMYVRLGLPGRAPQFIVEFYPYATVKQTLRLEGGQARVRISDAFAGAPLAVLEAAAQVLLARAYRIRPPAAAAERFRQYCLQSSTRRRLAIARRRWQPPVRREGQYFQLEALFEQLNQRYFAGRLRRPELCWSRHPWRVQMGLYDPVLRRIAGWTAPRFLHLLCSTSFTTKCCTCAAPPGWHDAVSGLTQPGFAGANAALPTTNAHGNGWLPGINGWKTSAADAVRARQLCAGCGRRHGRRVRCSDTSDTPPVRPPDHLSSRRPRPATDEGAPTVACTRAPCENGRWRHRSACAAGRIAQLPAPSRPGKDCRLRQAVQEFVAGPRTVPDRSQPARPPEEPTGDRHRA